MKNLLVIQFNRFPYFISWHTRYQLEIGGIFVKYLSKVESYYVRVDVWIQNKTIVESLSEIRDRFT